jgi:hypothetical protein
VAADTTAAAPAPRAAGPKIAGIDRTLFVVGAGALGVGLLYFWMKGKSSSSGGSGGQQGQKPAVYVSPTGLTNQQLLNWYKQHQAPPKKKKKA